MPLSDAEVRQRVNTLYVLWSKVLDRVRTRDRVTIQELAERTGDSRGQVAACLCAKGRFTLTLMVRYCAALKIGITFTDENAQKPLDAAAEAG